MNENKTKAFLEARLIPVALRTESFTDKETGEIIEWFVMSLTNGYYTRDMTISKRLVYPHDDKGKQLGDELLVQLFRPYLFQLDYDDNKGKLKVLSFVPFAPDKKDKVSTGGNA